MQNKRLPPAKTSHTWRDDHAPGQWHRPRSWPERRFRCSSVSDSGSIPGSDANNNTLQTPSIGHHRRGTWTLHISPPPHGELRPLVAFSTFQKEQEAFFLVSLSFLVCVLPYDRPAMFDFSSSRRWPARWQRTTYVCLMHGTMCRSADPGLVMGGCFGDTRRRFSQLREA